MKTIITASTSILKALLVFFSPIKWLVVLVALSTIIDTIFGIWRAKKTGVEISSKVARHGFIPKIISYVAAVLVVYFSDYYLINEFTKQMVSIDFLATKILTFILISIEVKSMDESFKKVKGYSFLARFITIIQQLKNIKKEINE